MPPKCSIVPSWLDKYGVKEVNKWVVMIINYKAKIQKYIIFWKMSNLNCKRSAINGLFTTTNYTKPVRTNITSGQNTASTYVQCCNVRDPGV